MGTALLGELSYTQTSLVFHLLSLMGRGHIVPYMFGYKTSSPPLLSKTTKILKSVL